MEGGGTGQEQNVLVLLCPYTLELKLRLDTTLVAPVLSQHTVRLWCSRIPATFSCVNITYHTI